MKKPTCRPWSTGSPQKTGRCAFWTMSAETGTDLSVEFCSCPPWPTRACVTQTATQLSMIVDMTSWTPTVAFRKPEIAAQAAPATAASATAMKMCSPEDMLAHEVPTHLLAKAPTRYWPCPPMLKRPHLKANETAKPV